MNLDPRYCWSRIKLMGYNPSDLRDFYFRGLTRRELSIAGLYPTGYEADNYILRSCVLPSMDWDLVLAGSADRLLHEINVLSGIGEGIYSIVWDETAKWIQSRDGVLEAVAIMMVDGCTPQELDTCDPKYYRRYITLGKIMWEATTGIPAEDAFKPRAAKGQKKETILPKEHVVDGKIIREPGKQVESFDWQKGQALNVPLE